MILENIFFNTSWHLQHIVIDMNKILHAAFLLCALAFLPLSCAFSMCEGSDDESDDDSLPPSAAAGPVKVKEGAAAAPAKEEILAGVPYTINCSSNPGANLEAFPRDGTITLARALRGEQDQQWILTPMGKGWNISCYTWSCGWRYMEANPAYETAWFAESPLLPAKKLKRENQVWEIIPVGNGTHTLSCQTESNGRIYLQAYLTGFVEYWALRFSDSPNGANQHWKHWKFRKVEAPQGVLKKGPGQDRRGAYTKLDTKAKKD